MFFYGDFAVTKYHIMVKSSPPLLVFEYSGDNKNNFFGETQYDGTKMYHAKR